MLKQMMSKQDKIIFWKDGVKLGEITVAMVGVRRTELHFDFPKEVRIRKVEHPDNMKVKP